jgi:drug/metabolite transporter (DMT)-like permease
VISASVPVIAGLVTGERPGPVAALGMAVAGAGVLLATRATGAPAEGQARGSAGLALALVAGVLLGVVLVGLDAAARADPLWAVLVTRSVSTLCVLAVVLPRRGGLALGRSPLPLLALIGVLDAAANALFALATTLGLLSVVTVLGSLYPVVTVLLARAVLGERVGAAQRAGVVAALGGVVLIAAG